MKWSEVDSSCNLAPNREQKCDRVMNLFCFWSTSRYPTSVCQTVFPRERVHGLQTFLPRERVRGLWTWDYEHYWVARSCHARHWSTTQSFHQLLITLTTTSTHLLQVRVIHYTKGFWTPPKPSKAFFNSFLDVCKTPVFTIKVRLRVLNPVHSQSKPNIKHKHMAHPELPKALVTQDQTKKWEWSISRQCPLSGNRKYWLVNRK